MENSEVPGVIGDVMGVLAFFSCCVASFRAPPRGASSIGKGVRRAAPDRQARVLAQKQSSFLGRISYLDESGAVLGHFCFYLSRAN